MRRPPPDRFCSCGRQADVTLHGEPYCSKCAIVAVKDERKAKEAKP